MRKKTERFIKFYTIFLRGFFYNNCNCSKQQTTDQKPQPTQEAHRYEDQKQDPAHSADGPFVHRDRAHNNLVWDKQKPDEYISEKYVREYDAGCIPCV